MVELKKSGAHRTSGKGNGTRSVLVGRWEASDAEYLSLYFSLEGDERDTRMRVVIHPDDFPQILNQMAYRNRKAFIKALGTLIHPDPD